MFLYVIKVATVCSPRLSRRIKRIDMAAKLGRTGQRLLPRLLCSGKIPGLQVTTDMYIECYNIVSVDDVSNCEMYVEVLAELHKASG